MHMISVEYLDVVTRLQSKNILYVVSYLSRESHAIGRKVFTWDIHSWKFQGERSGSAFLHRE